VRLALIALIALLSAGGYFLTRAAIRSDRHGATERHAETGSVRLRALLDRARVHVVGLANSLGDERAGQREFVELAGATTGSAGLPDALWIEQRAASAKLIATFTTQTRPELRPGVDVSNWQGLGQEIHDEASVATVGASRLGSLGGEPGFYVVEKASFGRPQTTAGYLSVFVSRSWLTLGLEGDPRTEAITDDGQRVAGQLSVPAAASRGFFALGRRWRIDVAATPTSSLQSLLPWLMVVWPISLALLAFLATNAAKGRRRAEQDIERVFESSLDLLGIGGFDGYWKTVNPAFERTLGYSREELLARPIFDFIHPEDVERTREAIEAVERGSPAKTFVNRLVTRTGEVRWFEWNAHHAPEDRLLYAAARDITDRRRVEEEVRAARARVVTAADETRRQIERDLHDGTQQRLVSLALRLRATEAKLPPELDEARSELDETVAGLTAALEDLQEISRGIHPAALSSGGLGVALKGLARRAGVPVELEIDAPKRLPDSIEVAAYYVVSEALTNAAKHARASHVKVRVRDTGAALAVAISDDGMGGTDPERGSGLVGLRDRVEALGGSLEIDSPEGGGTSLRVTIPVDG
jgi:PAS domain S-box-containing protein